MAKSHKTGMEEAEIIDTFGTYHTHVGALRCKHLRIANAKRQTPPSHFIWYKPYVKRETSLA